MRRFLRALVAALALATPLRAEPPQVVADIPALHGIAAALLDGLGEPALLLSGPASPHDFQLRPSDARALAGADVVVWVGAGLTPQISGPIEELAGDAHRIALLELPGVRLLPFREGALFPGAHAHGEGGGHADEHEEGHHAGHAHGEHAHEGHGDKDHWDKEHGDAGHDAAHGHAHADADEAAHAHEAHHAHGLVDPHAWLDPANARRLAVALRDALSEVDPDNAAAYERNHGRFLARLAATEAKARATLAQHPRQPFLLMHDSTQYFEVAFGIAAKGAVSDGDAARPGAARLAQLREAVRALGVRCLVVEPGPLPPLAAMFEGLQVVEADPLGQTLARGPEHYPRLIEGLADAFARCP